MSVESPELLLEKQYDYDFNEKDAEDKMEKSREEARFTEIMEQSVKLQDVSEEEMDTTPAPAKAKKAGMVKAKEESEEDDDDEDDDEEEEAPVTAAERKAESKKDNPPARRQRQ